MARPPREAGSKGICPGRRRFGYEGTRPRKARRGEEREREKEREREEYAQLNHNSLYCNVKDHTCIEVEL